MATSIVGSVLDLHVQYFSAPHSALIGYDKRDGTVRLTSLGAHGLSLEWTVEPE